MTDKEYVDELQEFDKAKKILAGVLSESEVKYVNNQVLIKLAKFVEDMVSYEKHLNQLRDNIDTEVKKKCQAYESQCHMAVKSLQNKVAWLEARNKDLETELTRHLKHKKGVTV
jgi:hypothetical protein